MPISLDRLLETRIEKTDACWLWRGMSNTKGYGRIRIGGRHIAAHRVVYEKTIGPIPSGMQIDHLCKVTNCVNPEHLEAVTPAENNRRSASPSATNAQKDVCKRGHAFTGRQQRGRRCLICESERHARKKQALREPETCATCKGHGKKLEYLPNGVPPIWVQCHCQQVSGYTTCGHVVKVEGCMQCALNGGET